MLWAWNLASIWIWITEFESEFNGSAGKEQSAMQETPETQVQFLGWEDPLEKEMATHSSNLAWKILWTEEPGGLHSPWGCHESDTTDS